MTDFELWGLFARGVLSHPDLAAPVSSTNLETLWAWGNAETAPYPLMRWWNPQNTTEPWPGARDSGAQPGTHDVKIYASLQDGINATVYTLVKEPYYGAIVANLRAGLPRQQWGLYSTAATELHAWGTGAAWLTATPYFGALPSSLLQEDDLTPEQAAQLDTVYSVISKLGDYPVGRAALDSADILRHLGDYPVGKGAIAAAAAVPQILQGISELKALIAGDQTALVALIADLRDHPSVAADPALSGKLDALSRHLGIGTA